MSCGLEMEKLKDFDKQLDEQAATLANQIQQLEAQLSTAKNTYLKVLRIMIWKEIGKKVIQLMENFWFLH